MASSSTTTTAPVAPDPSKKARKRVCVALVCDFFHPNLGGVESHVWSLAHGLARLGHKVVVITHAYDGGRVGVRYLPGPVKVYHCPFAALSDAGVGGLPRVTLPTFLATAPLLRWLLLREGVDLVHAHQATSTLANESLVYAAALNVPTVYTDHSLFGFGDAAGVVLNRVTAVCLRQVDAAVCVSHTCRDNLVLRAGLRDVPVYVIPNAVDATRFRRVEGKRHRDFVVEDTVVVVSRLVYRKGVDLLAGVITSVCRRLPRARFVVGGDGDRRLLLEETIERERLQDRVVLLGSVPADRVRDVLSSGRYFLNCSLTESFCIALLEAAACGLYPVSTNVGGVPEVLPDDMVELRGPTATDLADGLTRALEERRHERTRDFPARVARLYDWGRVVERVVRGPYATALAAPPRSFAERSRRYRTTAGPIVGALVCYCAVFLQLWLLVLEWYFPREVVDVVPDLMRRDVNEDDDDDDDETQTGADTLETDDDDDDDDD